MPITADGAIYIPGQPPAVDVQVTGHKLRALADEVYAYGCGHQHLSLHEHAYLHGLEDLLRWMSGEDPYSPFGFRLTQLIPQAVFGGQRPVVLPCDEEDGPVSGQEVAA